MSEPNLPPERWALIREYLDRGWALFPLGAGKRPLPNCAACRQAGPTHDPQSCSCLTCHAFYAASRDPERVELLFSMHPGAPIGLRTGGMSGVLVLDAELETGPDDVASGLTVFDHFQDIAPGVELPDTLTAVSESGGSHRFYRYVPGLVARNRIAPLLDVKAEGGYVVLPDEREKRQWLDGPTEPADAGSTLTAWLLGSRGGHGSTGVSTPGRPAGYDFQVFVRDGCPDGFRDEFTNDLAWRLRKANTTREAAWEIARDHWNRFAQPPTARYHMPWADVEYKLERIWATVEPDDPAEIPDEWVRSLGIPGQRAGTHDGVHGQMHVQVQEMPRRELATDRGNSERLVRLHGDRLRYLTSQHRWLLWDGSRWVRDDLDQVTYLARTVAEDIRAQADKCLVEGRSDEAKMWVQWALKCEQFRTIQSALKMAATDPMIALLPDRIDADRTLLAVHNGTVDLTTGMLRPTRRDDLLTRRADVAFDPAAECPRWKEHVALVTAGNADLAAYLQRAVGYTLTGLTSAQCFFLLEGDGSNGKSAFVEAVVSLLGDYAKVSSSALLTGGDEQHPTILADLQGARLVYVDEARQGRPINAERIKALTGSSTVSARRMGQDYFTYNPHLKLWISGNNHPSMRDSTDGIWRRMHRIMFGAKIPADRRVLDYGTLLHREEAAGILNWALEGLRDWQQLGQLGEPTVVREAVAEVRAEEDYAQQFLEECCRVEDDLEISAAELYLQFTIWWAAAGLTSRLRPTRVEFGRQLRVKGFTDWRKRVDGRQMRGYHRIGLIPGVVL